MENRGTWKQSEQGTVWTAAEEKRKGDLAGPNTGRDGNKTCTRLKLEKPDLVTTQMGDENGF